MAVRWILALIVGPSLLRIGFTHPFSGKSLHFKADLPADMASIKQAMSE